MVNLAIGRVSPGFIKVFGEINNNNKKHPKKQDILLPHKFFHNNKKYERNPLY